jgi:serine protease Do
MHNHTFKLVIWLALSILLIGLACNLGSTAQEATPTSPPLPTATREEKVEPVVEPTKETQPDQAGAPVSTLQGVEDAVVQIEAEGTFIDPEVGWLVNAAGRGTGFIIDPSGIAVTNNHVVTGAAILRVWLKGEDEPRNARVLGVSECSDLAVIKIDGEDFSYLEWDADEPTVGTQVFAAGFPLGDPEFTLTDGIISKSTADGETSWASVDSVIEHTAKINPGNSGGPLVDENGKAIGINYASVQETDQNFAIVKKDINNRTVKEWRNVDQSV